MKFADQTGITELITLTKTALKPLEAFKNSVTDVNGIVKSNGSGGFSAAVAGTDYAATSHTHTTEQVEGLSTAIEEAKPFIINVTGWTFGTGGLVEDAVADKTYSEAYAAYLAGKKVVMRVNGRELSMLEASNSNMTFSLALPDAADTLNSVDMASAVWSSDGSLECGDGLIQIPLLPSTAGLLKVTASKQIHLAVAGTDYAAADHKHDYLPLSGGTMTGPLVAQTNTSYTTAQMRNIIISTADPSGGNNGDIWLKYEA